jgi:hypothetical protein
MDGHEKSFSNVILQYGKLGGGIVKKMPILCSTGFAYKEIHKMVTEAV